VSSLFASFSSPARLNVFAYLTQGVLRGSILGIFISSLRSLPAREISRLF
jgi:hypothetical protein